LDDTDATQHFVSTLQHEMSTVQETPGIYEAGFPEVAGSAVSSYATIKNSLSRNRQLNHVAALLSAPPLPPPPQQQQQQQEQQQRQPRSSAATMISKLGTRHKAVNMLERAPFSCY
jgi:hypothetical protein